MKAIICKELNAPVSLEDVDITDPGPGMVRVKMEAAGVCHSDLSGVNGTIPWPTPSILGHEGAGVVTGVGDGVLSVAEGDHVIVNWVPFCGSCPNCMRGEVRLCGNGYGLALPHTTMGGAPVFPFATVGTFAEESVMHESSAIKIPSDVPLDIASLVGCGVTTGVGAAINTAKVEPGSTVVVIGCGGVGTNVIQGAKICGAAAVVAVDKVESKAKSMTEFGATHYVTPEGLGDLSQELTGGEGFDYGFEVIGSSATIKAAFDATRRGGTCVVVGVGRLDDAVSFTPFEIFYKEVKLLGCVYGGADVRRDFPRLLGLWKAGRLDLEGLISRRISLGDVQGAFDAMERGEVIRQVIDF